ncbi:AraC family transcriptional regulator [Taibaiella koreensis]|uniref:AraC family transcriptional regulator n=1 Tax=Taibaiella koreensis TaxID=1268548 RepID=UPI000E59E9C5|nr:AraC family transcriptional regulator [Taibaiella koreensis]
MEDFRKQFALSLLAYTAQRGLSPQALCQRAGIAYHVLPLPGTPAPDDRQMEALWQQATLETHDPFFGLHFGESMQLAALGVMGQILQSSSTAGEALGHAGALLHLVTGMFQMQINHEEQQLDLHLLYDPVQSAAYPHTFRQLSDYLLAFTLHELNGLTLHRITPLEVTLPCETASMPEYVRAFRCPVRRKEHIFRISLPGSVGDEPVLTANRGLQRYLLQQVQQLARNVDERPLLHTRIYNYLLTNSYCYALSQETVAANFHISPRNLQRKLKEEGITYLQIVESVRKTLATHYLQQEDYQVKDIASILGYNEQSAFVRAFRRWTGHTPTSYRQQLPAPAIVAAG